MDPRFDGMYDQTYRTLGADDGQLRWVRFWGQGYFSETGELYRFAGVAQEVTQQVETGQRLRETTDQLRSMIESAPFPIGVYTGPQMQIRFANQAIIQVYGKGPDVIGKNYPELLPELADQEIFEQLQQVYTTGAAFDSGTRRVNIEHQGRLIPYYFNYNFTPLFDRNGHVYGVMNTAADVTPLETARQQLAQSERNLRNAVEIAELGVWTLDLVEGVSRLSPQLADMFGLESTELPYQQVLAAVHPDDLAQVGAALEFARQPGSGGHYEVAYRIRNARTGQQQLVRARGELTLDDQGEPLQVVGIIQDITLERAHQLALENQVQQRTEQLAATTAELGQTNASLVRSNDNLQQFAYVASHDLQEPLRKIQSFGNLLTQQYAAELGDGAALLERMQAAAARMSALIQDLLTFSRLSTQQGLSPNIALREVVEMALMDLELVIEETKAQVTVGFLPMVRGDRAQLGQLFQNLLGNALKFRQTGVIPLVQVRSQRVAAQALPAGVQPIQVCDEYYQIDVIDNGIGFDMKYRDRIFQVFQRLHGKSQYVGTGIGLAICEKVVANQGGAITARSQPGQGATFSVYLPA